MALPRGLTWDLHADVAADVATTWQPLTSVLAMVNGGLPSLTVAVDRWSIRFRYEEEGSARGSEGVSTSFVEIANTRSSKPNYHNIPRSSNMIGLLPEWMKIPLPLGDYIITTADFISGC
nr:hypothetical protein [Tanacetum cinerariifolium]